MESVSALLFHISSVNRCIVVSYVRRAVGVQSSNRRRRIACNRKREKRNSLEFGERVSRDQRLGELLELGTRDLKLIRFLDFAFSHSTSFVESDSEDGISRAATVGSATADRAARAG